MERLCLIYIYIYLRDHGNRQGAFLKACPSWEVAFATSTICSREQVLGAILGCVAEIRDSKLCDSLPVEEMAGPEGPQSSEPLLPISNGINEGMTHCTLQAAGLIEHLILAF